MMCQVLVKDIDSMGDDVKGVYGWFPPLPNPKAYLLNSEDISLFYSSLYPRLFRITHETHHLSLEASGTSPHIFFSTNQVASTNEQAFEVAMQHLFQFIPPLYVGSSVRDDESKSIKARIKEEIRQESIGKRIQQALTDANLNRLFTIDDFIIKYVDIGRIFLELGTDSSDSNAIKQTARSCEIAVLSVFFPWLNKKAGA